MDVTTGQALIAGAAGLGGAVLAMAGTLLAARFSAKPATMAADAQIQSAINDGFAKLMAARDAQDAERKAEWTKTVTELRALVEHLTGEMRDLTQHLQSLETLMRKRGLGHIIPARPRRTKPQQLIVIEGGNN